MITNLSGITIQSYNPQWEETFHELKTIIKAHITEEILTIEHVGSTSVRGLGAKPIIDLDVVIEERSKLENVIQGLEKLGYIHQGDFGIKGREAFARQDDKVPWTGQKIWQAHHLYVVTIDNEELKRHLQFRNYLRNYPEAVQEYELLKIYLAKTCQTREAYTEAKSAFILNILQLAREELRENNHEL
ncbi:GrpB family protein [Cytobacillus purgationiresistens]|uniref:GrpB-like predicted nucleotidyltransferase (UPF0157 family) n=1 Tax=Cytobacillus purgationiresistens TaxID=863449 RepID=A0ABU0ALG9_9BACI|nr:GrpB family protein [Cytobacillus purgationiresistens]MDQ0271612.1 GrpB-like predicted nucleotidyltransferase (UPF0157 family) [Cytobacillus purgationiresistens]